MKVGIRKKNKKGYKEMRDRNLLDIWKKNRTWLKYDQFLNVMTCEWCVESGRFYMYQYMTRGFGNLQAIWASTYENFTGPKVN
jgi:hypothetical protein